ncbi:MAG: DUF547 domain-containing protein [Planctomycetota bacterium]
MGRKEPWRWMAGAGLAATAAGVGLCVAATPARDIVGQIARDGALIWASFVVLIVATVAAIVFGSLTTRGLGMRRTAWLTAAMGVVMLTTGGVAMANRGTIRLAVFTLATGAQGAAVERYADQAAGEDFDHAAWDGLLREHVADGGWIDYAGFVTDEAALDAYLAALGSADYEALSRDAKLAYLINAYNAFTVKLILDHWDGGQLESIMDIAGGKPWDLRRWNLAGRTVSLNELEHEIIRKDFIEPRIHFAVVCAAFSCPPLRAQAYTADALETQLQEQTIYSFTHPRWLEFEGGGSGATLRLTKLLDWYAGDFTQVAPSVEAYAGEFNDALGDHVAAGKSVSIEWIDYSWVLNDVRNRP